MVASHTDQMFIDLGLMKPGGELAFDPTGGTGYVYDFDEEDDTPAKREFQVEEEGIAGSIETRTNPQPKAAAAIATTPKDSAAVSTWESDDNPYKVKYNEAVANQPSEADQLKSARDQVKAKLDQDARDAYLHFSAMKDEKGEPLYHPAALAATIRAHHTELTTALQTEYERTVAGPVARRYAAEDIAKKAGGNVKVEDIINLPSTDAMVAVAQHIAKNGGGTATSKSHAQERDERFQERRASGVDTAESGSPLSRSVSEVFAKLPPKDKIAYSLKYQYGNSD